MHRPILYMHYKVGLRLCKTIRIQSSFLFEGIIQISIEVDAVTMLHGLIFILFVVVLLIILYVDLSL